MGLEKIENNFCVGDLEFCLLKKWLMSSETDVKVAVESCR